MPAAARHALLLLLAMCAACSAAGAHEGSVGNEAMWRACEGRKLNDACSFQNHEHDVYRGTCQSMSNAMVCVRNQPIERANPSAASHRHEAEHEPSPQELRELLGLAWAATLLIGGYVAFRLHKKTAA